jgi:hypothetical protein
MNQGEPPSQIYFEFKKCGIIKRTENTKRILVIGSGVVEIHRRDYRTFENDVFEINERTERISNCVLNQYNRIVDLKYVNLGEVFPIYVSKWKGILSFEHINEKAALEGIKEMTDIIINKIRFPFFNKIYDGINVYYKWKPYRSQI